MADLSVDQTQAPSIDDLVNAVGDLSAPDAYIPPRSGTYRTSRYPGFFTAGQTPSNTPNPVAGDNAVALPPSGVDPNAAASSDTGGSGLSGITSNPVGADPGDSAAERASTAEENGRAVGYDTDTGDLAKALNIATSFTGPTGIVGLGLTEGADALGFDPLGAGSSFDMKHNANLKPGWSAAYDAALTGAHAKGLTGQPAANLAGQTANANLDYNGEGRPNPNPGAVAQTPKPMDVTAANRVTGFQPASPSDKTATPGPTQAGTPDAGLTAATPAAPASPTIGPGAYNGQGRGANGGGGNGGGGFGHDDAGNSNAGRRGFSKGGVVTKMKSHHRKAAHANHQVMKQVAAKAGTTVPALIMKAKGAQTQLGARARLEATVMQMAHAQHKATGGVMTADPAGAPDPSADPSQSMQYNPPAELTQGTTDTVPAVLTPGEDVVTKPAAVKYDPKVKAAINNPQLADQINQLIEQFLTGQGDDGEDTDDADAGDDDNSPDAGTSDDSAGLGLRAPVGAPMPKTKLASVTRAA